MAESRVEDLLETGVEEPVLPMSEIEAILRGEPVKPHSRVAELLLKYNPSDILIEKRITENGTYFASADNADGYYKVVVDEHVPVLIFKEITANGDYSASDDNADGYSSIRVNIPLETQIGDVFNANGQYRIAPSQGYAGIESATVMVQVEPVLQTKTIDDNGTYTPAQGYQGFSQVTVAVPKGTNAAIALRCRYLNGYSVTITASDNSETYTSDTLSSDDQTVTFSNLTYVGDWRVTNSKDSSHVIVSNAVSNGEVKIFTPQIPLMTSYTTPEGVVSASSELDERFPAWTAINSNAGGANGWIANSSSNWLQYEFEEPVIFSKLHFSVANLWNYGWATNRTQNIDVEGSNDGTTFERCTASGTTFAKTGYGDVDILLNNKMYKYLRVKSPGACYVRDYWNCMIQWLQLYSDPDVVIINPASIHVRCLGVDGGTVTITSADSLHTHTKSVTLTEETLIFDNLEYAGLWTVTNSKDATVITVDNTYVEGTVVLMVAKIPTMTSATTPYGECISSSNNWGESRYVWYPFDGQNGPIDNGTSEAWSNQRGDNSPWIGYHFMDSQGNPIKVKMDKVWVQGFNVSWASSTTRTIYFEGSNDGTNWEKIGLDKVFDFLVNTRRSFEHELNGGKYEYFRIRFDASINVTDSRYTFIERIQVYANDFAPLPTGSLTATANGTYDPEDYDLSAFDEVTVNVPPPENSFQLKTASGSLVSFADGSDNPFSSLKINIDAVQSGSGDPYPPGGGKNKCDNKDATTNSNGTVNLNTNGTYGDVVAGTTYAFSFDVLETNAQAVQVRLNNANNSITGGSYTAGTLVQGIRTTLVFTPSESGSLNFWANTNAFTESKKVFDNVQLEVGNQATSYAPYSNIRPISGFTEANVSVMSDITNKKYFDGLLNGTYGFVDMGTLNWSLSGISFLALRSESNMARSANFIMSTSKYTNTGTSAGGDDYIAWMGSNNLAIRDSDYSNADDLKASLSGIYLLYELDTPTTPTITTEQFNSLLSAFNIDGHLYNISWQTEAGEVYGGWLDVVSGVLTVDRVGVDMGTLDWIGNVSNHHYYTLLNSTPYDKSRGNEIICSCYKNDGATERAPYYSTNNGAFKWWAVTTAAHEIYVNDETTYASVDAFKTAMSGQILCYPLATPLTYQLTPTLVKSLIEYNNLFADTGDVREAKYFSPLGEE